MKLLFVGSNRGPGGTESHLITLAIAMAAAGHDVSAAVWPDDHLHRALAADGRVRLYPARIVEGAFAAGVRDVWRACRASRADWVISSFGREYWTTVVAAIGAGVRVALFRHLDERFSPYALRAVSARLLPWLAHRIIVPSEFLRRRVVARGVPRRRTAVLPNPIDTVRFRPDPVARAARRAELGVADEVLVGFVGRIEEQKGVHTLLPALEAAMDRCESVRALFVGHGEDEGLLDAALGASRHARRFARRPWTTEIEDLAAYYAAMDVLAVPSTGPEVFGRVSAEAQACGVPVLASTVGGVPESIVPDATGLLVPPRDVEAWTQAVLALSGDAALRRRLGDAGRTFVVRRFDSSEVAAGFTALLTGVGASGG